MRNYFLIKIDLYKYVKTLFRHIIAIHFIRCYTTFLKLFYIILYFYLVGITLFCRFAYIIKNLEKMRYVKLTEEQASKINSKKIGLTSGKRNKETGLRPTIKFCSSLDFVLAFGRDVKREFIEI